MNAGKLRERSRNLALKTLAAVEAVERRIAAGETGPAIKHAADQLRGAVDSLTDLTASAMQGNALMDDETKRLLPHLDARVREIERRVVE